MVQGFFDGTILYGADGDFKAVINNLEDARSALRRTKAFGAFSVKSYNQPRREQRQQVMQAARELGINVYPEGGSFFYHNLSMVADGHTGVEHNIPVAPLYDDVIQFWSSTKSGNTPTLIVNYGGLNGEYFWYQNTNVWEDDRLLSYTPRAMIDSRSRHRTWFRMKSMKMGTSCFTILYQTSKCGCQYQPRIARSDSGNWRALGIMDAPTRWDDQYAGLARGDHEWCSILRNGPTDWIFKSRKTS